MCWCIPSESKFFFFTTFHVSILPSLANIKARAALASSPRKPDRATTTRSFSFKVHVIQKKRRMNARANIEPWKNINIQIGALTCSTNTRTRISAPSDLGGPRSRLCGWGRKSETLAIYCWLLNFLLCSSKEKMATIGIKYFTFRRGEKVNLGRVHKLCHMWGGVGRAFSLEPTNWSL